MAEAGVLGEYWQQREELIRLEKSDAYMYGADHHNTQDIPHKEPWHPKGVFAHWQEVDAALDDLRAQGCNRVLVLPMYPQYAAATTASAHHHQYNHRHHRHHCG